METGFFIFQNFFEGFSTGPEGAESTKSAFLGSSGHEKSVKGENSEFLSTLIGIADEQTYTQPEGLKASNWLVAIPVENDLNSTTAEAPSERDRASMEETETKTVANSEEELIDDEFQSQFGSALKDGDSFVVKGEEKGRTGRAMADTIPLKDSAADLLAVKGEENNQAKDPVVISLPRVLEAKLAGMDGNIKGPENGSGKITIDQGEEKTGKSLLSGMVIEKGKTEPETGKTQEISNPSHTEPAPLKVSNLGQSATTGTFQNNLLVAESSSESRGETTEGKDFLLSLMVGLKGTEKGKERVGLTGENRPLPSGEEEVLPGSGIDKARHSHVDKRDLISGMERSPEYSKEMTDKTGENPSGKTFGSGSPIEGLITNKAVRADFKTEEFSGTKVIKTVLDNGENAFSSSDKHSGLRSFESVLSPKEAEQLQKPFEARVLTQIVEKAVLNLKDSQTAIKINLKPEILGHLKMQISTSDSQVMLRILTETPLVKQIIESNISQLKAALQNFGLEIDECNVSVSHDSHQNKSDYEPSFFLKGEGDINDDANEEKALQEEKEGRSGWTKNEDGLIDILA